MGRGKEHLCSQGFSTHFGAHGKEFQPFSPASLWRCRISSVVPTTHNFSSSLYLGAFLCQYPMTTALSRAAVVLGEQGQGSQKIRLSRIAQSLPYFYLHGQTLKLAHESKFLITTLH